MHLRIGGVSALFLLVGLLVIVTPMRADNSPTYLYEINSSAVPGGFIPVCMAVDSNNNVYVTDDENERVLKFDKNGNYLTQWGSSGSDNGQFLIPAGIALDSDNNVYVTDENNNRIEKFDSNGGYLTQWGGQFNYPYGLATDSSNNFYVVDGYYNHRVVKFTSNGAYLTQWGGLGTSNGQFNTPINVAVDNDNNVYVTDYFNERVEKFDSNGDYLTQWGSLGNGTGQFNYPYGIAVDGSNNVYVTDENDNRIEKFDSNGNYLTQWGSPGSGSGQFNNPISVMVDRTGNLIYVADSYRIQIFANNSKIVPPIISIQPANQVIAIGMNVIFNVDVIGAAPFGYQWISNNVALPDETNATFALTNVSLFSSGNTYSVLVTNSFGGTLSSNVVLTVLPAVVITQPASSITLTSAVLNGLVTIGPDETVAWFEWGTDTNYGNISGTTIVTGNAANKGLATPLSGLPGNFYHYRLDAANDFGIVYGNDQLFTVGLPPTATTLPETNTANGIILNATVNPGNWDTTVYFRWGTTISLTNSTPLIDIGGGITPLIVSNLLSNLIPAPAYFYQVIASNHLGTAFGRQVTFSSPPFTSVPQAQWQSVASSADGTKLVAGSINASPFGGPISIGIYTSTNGGIFWTRASTLAAEGVASSADGMQLLGTQNGFIYISTNSGVSWKPSLSISASWNAIASSADGTKLAAVALNLSGVFTSTNSGVSWTRQTNGLLPYVGFTYIASSADGNKFVTAVGYNGTGPIFTSTNSGSSWIKATNAPLASWYSAASSADGNQLMACAYFQFQGSVYVSTNAGTTWIKTSLPQKNWNSVAESADGKKMVALANSGLTTFGTGAGGIYTSTDSGTTWISNNVPSGAWTCAAVTADGNELLATVGGPATAGGIYISQTTPSPILNISASSNTFISWIIPSLDFNLQQSPDLLSWVTVTNLPLLNLTNLQNQVVLPSTAGNNFFRLIR
jgi:hypothetical protein